MPANLPSLANELLTQIFSYADLREADNTEAGGRLPIQRVRLVCRLFAEVGARVLIPVLRIDYTAQSFARLDAVSRHPRIGLGVRVVDLRTDLHDATVAGDWDMYVSMKYQEFQAFAAIGENRGLYVHDTTPLDSQNDVGYDLEVFCDTCVLQADGSPTPSWCSAHVSDLRAGYRQYGQNMKTRANLAKITGGPEKFIAAALSRFRALRGLRFNTHLYSRFPWTACDSMEDVQRAKRDPSFWEVPGVTRIQEQHRAVFFALFEQFARHDVMFRDIELGIFAASDFTLAEELDQPMTAVRQVCRDLRRLSFNGVAPGACPLELPAALTQRVEPEPFEQTFRCLRKLFRGMTAAADRIESLEINNFEMGHPVSHPSMVDWLSSKRPWTNLKTLRLANCAIDGYEFVRFFEALPQPVRVSMGTMMMTEGTWKYVLEAIAGRLAGINYIMGGEIGELLEEPVDQEELESLHISGLRLVTSEDEVIWAP